MFSYLIFSMKTSVEFTVVIVDLTNPQIFDHNHSSLNPGTKMLVHKGGG